jgi:hypothetical protein
LDDTTASNVNKKEGAKAEGRKERKQRSICTKTKIKEKERGKSAEETSSPGNN